MSENQSIHETTKEQSVLQSSPLPTDVNSHIYDVIVVGAGPIGLATAIGLHKRGIENIVVLDQTRAFRQVGQGLDLLPNGLKALRCLDNNAYEAVKTASITFAKSQPKSQNKTAPDTTQKWHCRNVQGQIVYSIPLDFDQWVQDYGEGRLTISWYDLQTALRNLLPQNQVRANHRCINIVDEPESEYVQLDCLSDTTLEANPYAHWNDTDSENSENKVQESVTKSFRAKLIVAADGINSTIRRVMYQDSPNQDLSRPEYSGFAAITCQGLDDLPKELEIELEDKFLQGSTIVTIFDGEISKNVADDTPDIRILLFRRANQFGYIVHLPVALESLQNPPNNSLQELVTQVFEQAEFPDSLRQLVLLSPPANIKQRPYYVHRVTHLDSDNSLSTSSPIQPKWSAGRVVLVGDAAHGMPPFMAQGANQGLEDALVVATLIAKIAQGNYWHNQQAIDTAFEKYELLRRPLMAYVQQATLKRSPYASQKHWQSYSEQVYQRNFDEIIEGLL
ncbi:FAD-dependent oxidoreductase [Anabaena sp. FACHB-709]|uniref:FAD-binding domain-containing protein n=2 Tax=Nostocaceae TaxID=1162 RepID=A0A1Z4KI71_ANAVA|nr:MULTISPECIES: NAD(P)/FAD-dependent oxidoreductase [Nostocaceae]BAY68670.1 hypothetical protein NIES23_14580 [Trichormus variabilis NIES-23]HBW28929.1 FAD-dependent monooxygenase [Nostoc sp. UBA8866]MBD2170250.1 FAD-dependent monooxygenase [Anabaena cylindrica FACHB-318]MBD2262270.1 FAD-dependent monooxygenase [Anabaena sp. FACHB-709]MBD2271583.1 FAD-dependent monooxygenase [Nostoc sp. PCC 7120 = FACHB-418]